MIKITDKLSITEIEDDTVEMDYEFTYLDGLYVNFDFFGIRYETRLRINEKDKTILVERMQGSGILIQSMEQAIEDNAVEIIAKITEHYSGIYDNVTFTDPYAEQVT